MLGHAGLSPWVTHPVVGLRLEGVLDAVEEILEIAAATGGGVEAVDDEDLHDGSI